MKVFEVATGAFLRSFEGHTHHVLGVSWRADGRQLATCGADNAIKVWNFLTGEQVKSIGGFGKEVTSIQYVGIGDYVLVGAGDNKVSTKNTTGDGGSDFGGATDFVYCARSSADGKVFVAGGHDSVVRVWKEGGETIVNFEPPADDTSASIPPDGTGQVVGGGQ